MTKEELQAIREIMQQELGPIKEDIAELKESMEEVRGSTNYLAEWVEKLETAFTQHRITTKE